MADGAAGRASPYRSGPARALGLHFSVRCDDPALGLTLGPLLASLADGAASLADGTDPVDVEYTLDSGGAGGSGFSLRAGDDPVGQTATAYGAVSLLLWDVNRRAVAATPELLLLHAAAVAHQGRGLLLPGPSGAGKTTLAAGLARSGMSYLTDEVSALDPVAGELVPYPKPLVVKRGSWVALAGLGIVDDRTPNDAGDETPWLLAPSRIRAGAVGGRCPPRFVVVHRFVPGGVTNLAPLRRSAALVALAESSFQPLHRRPGGLEVLAEVVRGCECLDLTVGDLGEACQALVDHVERTVDTTP